MDRAFRRTINDFQTFRSVADFQGGDHPAASGILLPPRHRLIIALYTSLVRIFKNIIFSIGYHNVGNTVPIPTTPMPAVEYRYF